MPFDWRNPVVSAGNAARRGILDMTPLGQSAPGLPPLLDPEMAGLFTETSDVAAGLDDIPRALTGDPTRPPTPARPPQPQAYTQTPTEGVPWGIARDDTAVPDPRITAAARAANTGPRRWGVGVPENSAPRADAAVPLNPQGFDEPDWAQRPEGEDVLENFYFTQLMRMGDNAPKAFQQGFQDIQARKQARIGARADYQAQLIRDQFTSDLQRRNQEDRLLSTENQQHLNRVTQSRVAAMHANQRAQAEYLRRQVMLGQMAAQEAANKIAEGQEDMKFVHKVAEKVMPRVGALADSESQLRELQSLVMGNVDVGFPQAWQATKQNLGFHPNRERAQQLMAAIKLSVANAQKEGRFTDAERKLFAETMPKLGAEPEAWEAFFQAAFNHARRLRSTELSVLKGVSPYLHNIVDEEYGTVMQLNDEANLVSNARRGVTMDEVQAEAKRQVRP